MKVKEIMSTSPVVCAPDEHLGTAMWRMWKADCGFLPVTRGDQVVGVITDRDVAVTLALRGRTPEQILVGEIMQGCDGVVACEAEDSVRRAMDLMRDHQLRRLPVVENAALVGVVSLNDLVLAANGGGANSGRPTFRDVTMTLRGVCAHRSHAAAA